MIGPVRASLAAVLVLLVAAPAAAQSRACTAADSARVGWSPPPGANADSFRAALLSGGLVAPETELVHIPFGSLHRLGDEARELHSPMIEAIQARIGDGPAKVVILARIESDSTLSRLVLALPSGMVGIEESLRETTRRLRLNPAIRDGCPMAMWYPITVETSGTLRIGETAGAARVSGVAASEWVSFVSINRLRDELADRPAEASLEAHNTAGGWSVFERPVVLPEPFRSRAFKGESFLLLDVDSAGGAAGCRPLRASAHPELDTLGCTLLTGRLANLVQSLDRLGNRPVGGRRVIGMSWVSLTAAAHRERGEIFSGRGTAGPLVPPPPPPAEVRPPPGGHWVKAFQFDDGGVHWIDTSSVSRIGEDVFRFTVRYTGTRVRTRAAGLPFDGTERLIELDCAKGESRTLHYKWMLGERVVDENESPGQSWSREGALMRDPYCPVLRRARPAAGA